MEIVQSHILSRFPEILFGMSTKIGGVSQGSYGLNLSFHVNDHPDHVKENRRLFFSSLGISEDNIAFTRQEHTTDYIVVDQPGVNKRCDALITSKKGLYLSISVADCTPVLLYDPIRNVVAGIHAGWRGTAGKIVEKTLHEMQSRFQSNASDIVAFIGPSAGVCCYEVGEEVASRFSDRCVVRNDTGKIFLDVKSANVMQLLESGVLNSNIEVKQDCTIHNTQYHSHRRDGQASGRMHAIIGIKG